MRKRNIGNEFSCGWLFHFLIAFSLRGKEHMDWWAFLFSNYCLETRKRKHGSHEVFVLLSMFYVKNTKTGGYKSHLCSPIITIWNTNKWLFESLFVFPIQWHQAKKQKMAYTGDFAFLFSFFSLRIERNESMYNGSYFYFSFLVCGLGKKGILRHPFSIFYYEIEKRKTKGRYIHGPISL